jgi:uroporphyrinogen decarboxylase
MIDIPRDENPEKKDSTEDMRFPGKGGQTPRWIPNFAQAQDHVMKLANIPARVFYREPKPFIEAHEAVWKYYGFDTIALFADVYNFEAEALGQKMIYGNDAMPTVDTREPLIKQPEDLAKIQIPDWPTAGRISYRFEIQKYQRDVYNSLFGVFCAPFSLAVALRGYPMLIQDMRRDPAFAHELFTFIVDEVLCSYLESMNTACGATVMSGADAWAVFPNMSPKLADQWVVPYNKRLQEKLVEKGMTYFIAGVGDYCEEDTSRFDRKILFDCLDIQRKFVGRPEIYASMGRWDIMPIEPLAEYLANSRADGLPLGISVGVNARMLRNGPVEKIVENIKHMIDVLARENPMSFFIANIPADTPSEHVHAAVAAIRTFGRYPIAANLDEVPFEVPRRESFEVFRKQLSNSRFSQ